MKLKYNFYAQTIIQLLIKEGSSAEEIYSHAGMTVETDNPLETELTIEAIHHLTILFKEKTGISHCGLWIIKQLDFRNTDFFGPYAFSCRTLEDAVRKIQAVSTELNPWVSYEMIPKEKPSNFEYALDKRWEASFPESAREIMDFIIANGLLSARSLTGKEIIPLRLNLKREAPEDISIYNEIFRCPVYFSQESDSIDYPPSIMDYPIPTYNPTLLSILHEFAKKTIEENETNRGIVAEVKALIMKVESYQIPKEDEVADQLSMSKRTLQKKLNEQSTSFHQILDGIKMDLALAYLDSRSISIKETAFMLGYNDISNFYRAFKRWTGLTPKEYKAQQG